MNKPESFDILHETLRQNRFECYKMQNLKIHMK